MGNKPARNKPFTFYVTNVVDYEAFIRFLNNAGFEIRTEDWRYTKMGILLTFPMRDHAWQFRNVMSGRPVVGDPVTIVRATTQKMGPDTRESKAVPTEAAILDALRDTYAPSAPSSTAALQPEIVQSSWLSPPPNEESHQSEAI